MPLTAYAVPRGLSANLAIDFDRATVVCEVEAAGNNISQLLQTTLEFKHGSTVVATRYAEDYGYVYLFGDADTVKGRTYGLVATVVFNGVPKPQFLSAELVNS